MAAPTYAHAWTAQNNLSISYASPSPANGEYLVLCVIHYDTTNVPSTPATWTSVGQVQRTTGNITCSYIFRRLWTTGDATSLTITTSGSPYTDQLLIGVSGVDTSSPFDTTMGLVTAQGAAANPAVPAGTTTETDELAVLFHAGYTQGLTADPTTWTARISDQDTVNDAFTKEVAVAGSIGGQAVTQGNDSYNWTMLALRSTTSTGGGGAPTYNYRRTGLGRSRLHPRAR